MTTTTILAPPVILTPTNDPTPVEKAVVDGILDDFEPETYLSFVFNRPDGGARTWDAWTTGGQPLGDSIDQHAMAADLDAVDWFHIADRHGQHGTRGCVEITAYPLRLVLADVQSGVRGPDDQRVRLRAAVAEYCGIKGLAVLPADERDLPWLGFGPALRAKRH